MSQTKVDKYKKEKKNRAKTIKKQKRNQYIKVCICAGILGGILGYPIGRMIYKQSVKDQAERRTVLAQNFDAYTDQYWFDNYAGVTGLNDYDATEDASTEEATTEGSTESAE